MAAIGNVERDIGKNQGDFKVLLQKELAKSNRELAHRVEETMKDSLEELEAGLQTTISGGFTAAIKVTQEGFAAVRNDMNKFREENKAQHDENMNRHDQADNQRLKISEQVEKISEQVTALEAQFNGGAAEDEAQLRTAAKHQGLLSEDFTRLATNAPGAVGKISKGSGFDFNGNGKIDNQEMLKVVQYYGEIDTPYFGKAALPMIEQFSDAVVDGGKEEVDAKSFRNHLAEQQPFQVMRLEKAMNRGIDEIDTNGDGVITGTEMIDAQATVDEVTKSLHSLESKTQEVVRTVRAVSWENFATTLVSSNLLVDVLKESRGAFGLGKFIDDAKEALGVCKLAQGLWNILWDKQCRKGILDTIKGAITAFATGNYFALVQPLADLGECMKKYNVERDMINNAWADIREQVSKRGLKDPNQEKVDRALFTKNIATRDAIHLLNVKRANLENQMHSGMFELDLVALRNSIGDDALAELGQVNGIIVVFEASYATLKHHPQTGLFDDSAKVNMLPFAEVSSGKCPDLVGIAYCDSFDCPD
eukprot:g5481.t1